MFDSSLSFKLVQIRRNKHYFSESFNTEFVFKFHCHNVRGCIKYVVTIKSYEDGLLTLDYYPKINLTPKSSSLDNIQDLRYRMLTRQNSFGVIGGTIMEIMLYIKRYYQLDTWGFLAANLVYENSNENNRRYQVYKEVLRRSFQDVYSVFGNRKNSAIFVIPIARRKKQRAIVKRYESIFAETN